MDCNSQRNMLILVFMKSEIKKVCPVILKILKIIAFFQKSCLAMYLNYLKTIFLKTFPRNNCLYCLKNHPGGLFSKQSRTVVENIY